MREAQSDAHRRACRHSAHPRLADDYENLLKVNVSEAVIRLAGKLAETHALRGFDAVHLASAAWLAKKLRMPVRLLAFDDRLNRAARALKRAVS